MRTRLSPRIVAAWNDTLGVPFIASVTVHIVAILLGAVIVHNRNARHRDLIPINLIGVEQETPVPLARPKFNKPPAPKAPILRPEIPPRVKEEPTKPAETNVAPPIPPESRAGFTSSTPTEDGGGAEGAGDLFGRGDVGAVPGTGTAGAGGGTASAGPGRGSGTTVPLAQTVLKTNREARPIQSARASYPLMALRRGLEADVTLRIIVGPEGNVTLAEIAKSGGAGFDEEALKAVKQSRFEPAQREGRNVPAEFTYIFRFRLQR